MPTLEGRMVDRVDQLIEAAEDRWMAAWRAGPTRLRWTSLPPQPGDPAPDAELPDHEDRLVRLSSLWVERPLLVLFWRHFGCSCGMDRAARLRSELADYRAAGGDVVIIGQGEPARAARYRERQRIEVPILTDPDRATYQAYGLLQGTPAQILFDAPDEFLRCEPQAGLDLAASRHGTDRALVDDPWQLPGEVVVGTDGVIRSVHRYGWCEDYPDPRVHIAVIREAAGRL
jgi:peroxiredoxin